MSGKPFERLALTPSRAPDGAGLRPRTLDQQRGLLCLARGTPRCRDARRKWRRLRSFKTRRCRRPARTWRVEGPGIDRTEPQAVKMTERRDLECVLSAATVIEPKYLRAIGRPRLGRPGPVRSHAGRQRRSAE